MKFLIGGFIGLVLSIHVGAEPLLEGRVRLSSGQPAVGVQVRLLDLTDLRRFVKKEYLLEPETIINITVTMKGEHFCRGRS